MTQITITLSDEVYERATVIAHLTGKSLSEVLADAASAALTIPVGIEELPIEAMTDSDIIVLAESQMTSEHSERLAILLNIQQTRRLSEPERAELDGLMEYYHLGQLRKATALRVAVQRGILTFPQS